MSAASARLLASSVHARSFSAFKVCSTFYNPGGVSAPLLESLLTSRHYSDRRVGGPQGVCAGRVECNLQDKSSRCELAA